MHMHRGTKDRAVKANEEGAVSRALSEQRFEAGCYEQVAELKDASALALITPAGPCLKPVKPPLLV